MFSVFKKSPTNVATRLDRAVIPFPTARVPARFVVELQEQRSYEELTQLLGFIPSELIRVQLLEFFEIEGIKLYEYNQVRAWLTDKKEQVKARNWCWRPLREKDIITGYSWGEYSHLGWTDGFYSSNEWGCRPYERLVPINTLERVLKIEAKFGDRVKFFVSDYVSPNPDPFIMVCPAMPVTGTAAEYHLIFDAWDEPGFSA